MNWHLLPTGATGCRCYLGVADWPATSISRRYSLAAIHFNHLTFLPLGLGTWNWKGGRAAQQTGGRDAAGYPASLSIRPLPFLQARRDWCLAALNSGSARLLSRSEGHIENQKKEYVTTSLLSQSPRTHSSLLTGRTVSLGPWVSSLMLLLMMGGNGGVTHTLTSSELDVHQFACLLAECLRVFSPPLSLSFSLSRSPSYAPSSCIPRPHTSSHVSSGFLPSPLLAHSGLHIRHFGYGKHLPRIQPWAAGLSIRYRCFCHSHLTQAQGMPKMYVFSYQIRLR